MQMPGRKYLPSLDYRYGFNKQEYDKEINSNITTAEFWEYDSRIGRRWNIDPVTKAEISAYSTFGDNPILYNDVKGDDWYRDKQRNIIWNNSRRKRFTDEQGVRYRNIGSSITIRTTSVIKNPNDLPIPNSQLREDGAGDKLITFITITGQYKNGKFSGFATSYKKEVGASFDLKGLLDGVNYPNRPNTGNGIVETSEKSLDINTYAHVTTPKIESIGLDLLGKKVDVMQDMHIFLNASNKLNIEITHGTYPSVDMTIIGSSFMWNPNEYISFYNYQQASFLSSHATLYLLLNYKNVKNRVIEMTNFPPLLVFNKPCVWAAPTTVRG